MTEIEFYKKALADYEQELVRCEREHGRYIGDGVFACGFCFYARKTKPFRGSLYDKRYFKRKLPILYSLGPSKNWDSGSCIETMALDGHLLPRIELLKKAIKIYEERSDLTTV